jgi:hypothetical protein
MAMNCDIDHSDIKEYEMGIKNPKFLTMVDLAKGLGIDLKELYDFDITEAEHPDLIEI